jgi:hypothetical protein
MNHINTEIQTINLTNIKIRITMLEILIGIDYYLI